ncbi:nucleotide disphospho-sugar-binding domain-containing protein [Frigoribacterium sp. CFBP 8751]|uniref:nucleotide disphospho-sugar-binding domain-containing protein n=1 Tax=Frigoribacterium sp. CFBP 8751 TaxID=2775277 RepID=UPI001780E791|nr:glycosyltransferase [Frigoribacterium sp. CFBP 8751]MBD8540242.1 glycosyltransferase family 1 protein [Frigoribacterium sp. CFBP 8751]
MTLLVISPDYASHLLPLATLATEWRDRGERVVVATGPATAAIVESFGFERVHLQLGRGSNPGVIRAEEQVAEEDASLRGFFDATRLGMVETLSYQARERLTDLMWQPVATARAVLDVVAAVRPDQIVVDHLAFSARLALVAGGVPFADVVLGHPTALPVGDEVYGCPPEWPAAFGGAGAARPVGDAGRTTDVVSNHPHAWFDSTSVVRPGAEPEGIEGLRELCERVDSSFTAEWNAALAELAPHLPPSTSAFGEHGDLLLYNYPGELADPEREHLLPPHVWLGSAVRAEPVDAEVAAWLAAGAAPDPTPDHDPAPAPFVYVSFGSFLSVRSDVLGRVAEALRRVGVRAAIALGSGDRSDLGEVPADWLVREFLPQVTLLDAAAAAVTHGGNNSVTEAMTAGVPVVVLPFSTDQFAGAAALERTGVGVALAPNTATVDELAEALRHVLDLPTRDPGAAGRLAGLAASLRETPGRARAHAALTGRG